MVVPPTLGRSAPRVRHDDEGQEHDHPTSHPSESNTQKRAIRCPPELLTYNPMNTPRVGIKEVRTKGT